MLKPMLDGKLMFPNEYLAAEDFGGKDVTLTIREVEFGDLKMTDDTTKRKPVVHFEKTDKKFVLNKTNATEIAKLHGGEARGWAGKKITLYPTTCQAFRKTVDCIRVRSKLPKAEPEQRPPSNGSGAPVISEGGGVPNKAESGAPDPVPDEDGCKKMLGTMRTLRGRKEQLDCLGAILDSACYDTEWDPANIKYLIAEDRLVAAVETMMRWQGWL